MTEQELFAVRRALIQAFLRENRYDGVLLSRADNFAMATGGKRNYVGTGSDLGAGSLFIGRDGRAAFIGNHIETPRHMGEELSKLDCEFMEFPWFAGNAAERARREFPGELVSDDGALGKNVHSEMAVLRSLLTEAEQHKYRQLGAFAAEAMEEVLAAVEPDMPEADIAALLVAAGARRRCRVPVALVAADERIARYRHPLPTEAPLWRGALKERRVQRYVMVVAGFVREGLVVSMTRFKRVSDLPEEVMDAYNRICAVDACMQQATEPGATLGAVFQKCQEAYRQFGFAENEWHHHHQGGTTGYAGRTCKGAPDSTFPVLDTHWPEQAAEILGHGVEFGGAFAWNPSAPGVKSEDTFLLLPNGAREIITRTPGLPQAPVAEILGAPTEVVKSGMAGA